MLVNLTVNDGDTGPHSNYRIGTTNEGNNWCTSIDIAEIIAFDHALSNADAAKIEGYLALKWGLKSSLPSVHNYKNYTSWPDMVITTGQAVNLQIPADRNPTSWTASGLASGLSINNSGIISGSVSSLSAFSTTVTAINSDGNDSKAITFGVSKGNRVIDWNQTFGGIAYGDAPLSLNATATGTGALTYSSNDIEIVEINGTSAIIRGGGSVTLTANAAENSTAFAAVPVSYTFSVARAPLTITGQDLTITQGAAIPTDLNYTVSGWKHNDASAAIAKNPSALGLKLWLDASDSSTITESSGAVSQWSDKSGNSNHVVQSTADNKPKTSLSSLNGLNTLSFDGTDYLQASSSNIKNENQTWVLIASVDAEGSVDNSADSMISYGNWVDGSWELRGHDSYRFFGKVAKDGTTITTSNSSSSDLRGTTQLYSITFDRTNSKLSAWRNGTVFDNAVTDTRALLQNNKITIMANRSGTPKPIMGTFAEVVCFTSASASDRQSIEGYLAHKWGLVGTLPSNHSHKTVSLTRGPVVTTDATQSNAAGTYYIRPSDAASKKYSLAYIDGQLIKSSLTEQTISWGQNFSGVGVGQTVDLNASVGSGLAVLYSVSDPSIAELAVTNQSSLQAWYKLDETSGDAQDSSANSNIGSLRNGPAYTAGKFGNAITLDGTNDHVRTYGFTGSKLDSSSNEIGVVGGNRRTVALWFKTSTANKTILQYGASGTATLFKLSLNNSGAVVLDLGGSTITSSSASHANGTWHHVAVTIPANGNTGEAKLYVDGSRTNGSGSTSINTASSADLIIGRDGTNGSSYFSGQIDDVRFYGAELNATLIGQLYGNGNGDFNRLKVLIAGSVTLTANQPGNSQYATAPASTITATFDKSDQTISFSPIPDKSVGDFDFSPTAVASSGLPVTFSSSNSLIAQIQGTAPNQTIKIRAAGTATITASQIGNGAYNTAPSVTQTVTVGYFNLQANSLPGIRLWLDGNNINGDDHSGLLANGSAVTQWIDQSGNTNNAGQGTTNAKPTYAAMD